MNSGALSQLIHQCPYRFNGIDVIANIFFVLNLVLYIIFSCLFTLRFIWFRGDAYREIISNMAELTFTSCWSIAFMTLTSGVSLIVSNAWWGGYPFSIVAYVMFWFVQAWNALFLLWAFITLIRNHEASDRRIPFSIIIPAVSVATAAISGAIVATYSKDLSAGLAVPVMIVSFNWGRGGHPAWLNSLRLSLPRSACSRLAASGSNTDDLHLGRTDGSIGSVLTDIRVCSQHIQ